MSKFAYDREVQNWIGKRFLETLLPLLACLIVFVTAVAPFAMPEEFGRIAWSFCYLPGLAVCFWLVRRGYVRLVVALTTLAMLQAITFAMLFYGGVRSPVYVGGMTALCLAVWYYPRRMAVLIWGLPGGLGGALRRHREGRLAARGPGNLARAAVHLLRGLLHHRAGRVPGAGAHAAKGIAAAQGAAGRRRRRWRPNCSSASATTKGLSPNCSARGRPLVQREAKLREAQHIAKLGYWSRDVVTDEMLLVRGDVLPWRASRSSRFTPALLLQVLHPEGPRARPRPRRETARARETARELRFVRPDGEVRWLADKWWSEFDADGARSHALRGGAGHHRAQAERAIARGRGEAEPGAARCAPISARVLGVCLDAAIEASGLDCGGIYTERPDGGLRLACHRGCTPAFLAEMREMPPEHPSVQVVRAGQPGLRQLLRK